MPVFTPISHAAFVADVAALATAIRADADWTPSYIVGIGRGGLVPAVYLSHATGLPMLSCDWSSKVADFAGDVVVRLAAHTKAGERLLFVDDINDSGLTIGALRHRAGQRGRGPRIDPDRDADRQPRVHPARRLPCARDRPDGDEGLVCVPLGGGGARRVAGTRCRRGARTHRLNGRFACRYRPATARSDSAVADALDIRAHRAQFLLQPFIAAVEVIHPRHLRLALRR